MTGLKHGRTFGLILVKCEAIRLIMSLIASLLEVPSAPFGFRGGATTFAGWVLLFLVSVVAVESVSSVLRRWLVKPTPPRAYDPYLMALSEMEKERRG